MHRAKLLVAVFLLGATSCRPDADKEVSPDTASEQTLVVRLVDEHGGPVAGAHVGEPAYFFGASEGAKEPTDESGWRYARHAISDGDGVARVTAEALKYCCVVARHVAKKLVAIHNTSPGELKGVITVTMRPQCRIVGRLVSSELRARGRNITWSNVYLYSDGKRAFGCTSERAEFHFYVPPGTYKLDAYGDETYSIQRMVTVQPGQQELEIEPINLPPTRLAMLEGEPAPELRDIVAWKGSEPLKLAELRGKFVLLEFWGYWCGPCVGSMPDLFSLYDKYHDQGLVIIGIHQDVGDGIDSAAKLDAKLANIKKSLWKGRDIPFPVALVLERQVAYRADFPSKARSPLAAEYGITGYPTGVLIDRQGHVVGKFHAGYKPDEVILEKTLGER